MKVYIDKDFRCHLSDDGTMTEADVDSLMANVIPLLKVTAMIQAMDSLQFTLGKIIMNWNLYRNSMRRIWLTGQIWKKPTTIF